MIAFWPRVIIAAMLVAGIVAGWWRLTAYYDHQGYERRRLEDTAAMEQQAENNRELQRAAEKKYVVKGEVQNHYFVTTVKEIRRETENLAACALTPAAIARLRDAAKCASEDTPGACVDGKPVPAPRRLEGRGDRPGPR